MQPGEAVSRCPLEKPFHLLTEHDISQLTREDCRRYLKQKGMRRPSWNKAQAIKQVILLKSLLQTTPRNHIIRRPPRGGHSDSNADEQESAANRPPDDVPQHEISAQITSVENHSLSLRRTMEVTSEAMGQMTIFYSGKVNVFDDISGDKARIIMQIAASPLLLPHAAPSNVISALWPFQSHLQAASAKFASTLPSVMFPRLQTENDQLYTEGSNRGLKDNPEGQKSRKASVQRYLEKRKDRFKHKKKVALPSSGRWDVYLNRVLGDQQISNHQLNKSDSHSPSQPRPPQTPTRSNSNENNNTKWQLPQDSFQKLIKNVENGNP